MSGSWFTQLGRRSARTAPARTSASSSSPRTTPNSSISLKRRLFPHPPFTSCQETRSGAWRHLAWRFHRRCGGKLLSRPTDRDRRARSLHPDRLRRRRHAGTPGSRDGLPGNRASMTKLASRAGCPRPRGRAALHRGRRRGQDARAPRGGPRFVAAAAAASQRLATDTRLCENSCIPRNPRNPRVRPRRSAALPANDH